MNCKDILDKYKKGLISYEEYDEEISKTNSSDLTLQEQLERKLLREYAKFIRGLIGKSKYDILDKSYEITCKEQIQNLLSDMDLDDKEIIALLEEKDVLTSFYDDWLDDGFNYLSDSMENSVGESIADVTKYYYKNKQKDSRER